MASESASTKKTIWKTFFILLGLTVLEFIIAGTKAYYADLFGISLEAVSLMVLALFIILTIFKAFYIVAEFMHLRHEVKRLIWLILVPFIFVVWLIIGLLLEGNHWGS